MFDIGWTELLVIAVVAILVVGPKDLPGMLRTFGQTIGRLKRMASDFQGQFNDALREAEKQAEIDDVKQSLKDVKENNPLADVKADLAATENDMRADIDSDTREEKTGEGWTESIEAPAGASDNSIAGTPVETPDKAGATDKTAEAAVPSEAKS